MGFESGYYMVRSVMLERAVDISVRNVRLGNGKIPQLAAFKEDVCQNATILPDCENSIQVEMVSVDMVPGAVAALDDSSVCIDRRRADVDQTAFSTYDVGTINKMVLVRVCAVASPLFPTTGIGSGMKRTEQIGENYAMIATTAFVAEPGTRDFDPYDDDDDDDDD